MSCCRVTLQRHDLGRGGSFGFLGRKRSEELVLFLRGLEAAVAEFGRGIDELEVNFFEVGTLRVCDEALSESEAALLGSHDAALKHEPILVDLAVVREASEGRDRFFCEISFGRGRVGIAGFADAVDFFVHLGTVVVSVLSRASDRERDARRMPSSDTGDFAQPAVGFAGQSSHAPSLNDALGAVSARGAADVDHLVGVEDRVDWDFLLEERLGVVDLFCDRSSAVDLDLHEVGLLLTKLELFDLGVRDDADHRARLLDFFDGDVDLASFRVLLGILGHRLSLAVVPVLVEPALDLLGQKLRKHRTVRSQAAGRFHVSDHADNHHRRCLENRHRFHHFLFVQFRSWTLDVADDVGHACFVGHERCQMRRLRRVVARKRTDATVMVLGALLREKPERTVARSFELAMRHLSRCLGAEI